MSSEKKGKTKNRPGENAFAGSLRANVQKPLYSKPKNTHLAFLPQKAKPPNKQLEKSELVSAAIHKPN